MVGGTGDDGRPQLATRVVYDPVGAWGSCTPKQLTYWHSLEDENYTLLDDAEMEQTDD